MNHKSSCGASLIVGREVGCLVDKCQLPEKCPISRPRSLAFSLTRRRRAGLFRFVSISEMFGDPVPITHRTEGITLCCAYHVKLQEITGLCALVEGTGSALASKRNPSLPEMV
ncbi:hypothetical protein KP509_09G023000 [Ceratopteris richardii]|uniref:Uncharacterized protein n=1 Tax=Ceratopteris richardii TaxID=49495 RepID=A0A8T2U5M9_CERRI|nr:hypothetical protein KP509_09G023000 [Ceratopteris richardii]